MASKLLTLQLVAFSGALVGIGLTVLVIVQGGQHFLLSPAVGWIILIFGGLVLVSALSRR